MADTLEIAPYDPDWAGGWPHTHHIHVVQSGGDEERRTLAFRDHLRAHPDVAHEYAALKRDLAAHSSARRHETRQAYAETKRGFIERITRRALTAESL